MKILFIGDIFGEPGRKAMEQLLPGLVRKLGAEVVIANGENSAGGLGINGRIARDFWDLGVDVITTGNHVWRQRDVIPSLEEEPRLLRPANYPPGVPGHGWVRIDTPGGELAVVNLQGRVYMGELDCPFRLMDALLARELAGAVTVIDMHAEATSEKQALAWHLDGRVAAVVGTHTHVQTADEKILPQGTAYISDLGLTGPHQSVIGMDPERAVDRFLTQRPLRFKVARGDTRLQGALVEVDMAQGKATGIQRVDVAA